MTIVLLAISKENVNHRRAEIFEALKKVYFDEHGENLPIFGVVRVNINIYSPLAS